MASDSSIIAQELAATKIQRHVRGFLARRKYTIQSLTREQLTDYQVLVTGNDPEIPFEKLQSYRTSEPIALIATSGVRALSIACALSDPDHVPKIILVDNSELVYLFWDSLREYVADGGKGCSEDLFLDNLRELMQHNRLNIRPSSLSACYERKPVARPASPYGLGSSEQTVIEYFEQLIAIYGYDYVRNAIKNVSLIRQSWEDTTTFVKIKNILHYCDVQRIFTYPSNIVACTDTLDKQLQIIQNITSLNPVVSIHTDLKENCPTKVIFTEDNSSGVVLSNIFSDNPEQNGLPAHTMADSMLVILELAIAFLKQNSPIKSKILFLSAMLDIFTHKSNRDNEFDYAFSKHSQP